MKGLQTEIPDGMELTAQTIHVLRVIEQENVANYQPDDSPDAQETVEQLREICDYVAYEFLGSEHSYYIIGDVTTISG